MRQIVKQAHEPPDETEIKTLQASARREKDELLKMQCEQVRESLPSKTERAVELATEKGASNWLTVIPIEEMNFNLNKREFREAKTFYVASAVPNLINIGFEEATSTTSIQTVVPPLKFRVRTVVSTAAKRTMAPHRNLQRK